MQSRRALLVGGAGVAALALGGLGYRAWNRGLWSGGEGPAYAPWSDWAGNSADGIKRPLRAAILASNPHDTQPWLFDVGKDTITLFADRSRNLGTFDPFRRAGFFLLLVVQPPIFAPHDGAEGRGKDDEADDDKGQIEFFVIRHPTFSLDRQCDRAGRQPATFGNRRSLIQINDRGAASSRSAMAERMGGGVYCPAGCGLAASRCATPLGGLVDAKRHPPG